MTPRFRPAACTTCGGSPDSPPCSLNRDLGLSGHTYGGGVAANPDEPRTRPAQPEEGDRG